MLSSTNVIEYIFKVYPFTIYDTQPRSTISFLPQHLKTKSVAHPADYEKIS